MDDTTFEMLIEEALTEIPAEFKELLENVIVTFEEYPGRDKLTTLGFKGGGLLLGLYEGLPQTRRGRYGIGGNLPDKITIYKYPILKLARSYEDVKELVKDTVKHEIAHHFGMDEESIRKTKK